MGALPQKKPFRFNPVEIVLFTAVFGFFLHSAFRLFNSWDGLQPAQLTKNLRAPASTRDPAAKTPLIQTVTLGCENKVQPEPVRAPKIALEGTLCGIQTGEVSTLLKTEIMNQTNRTSATTLTNAEIDKRSNAYTYTTELLPLVDGENRITIKFVYTTGRIFTQEVLLIKE